MANPEQSADASPQSEDSGVNFKKRFLDTQSAYTKSQQELKATKAKLEALEKLTTPKVELDEAKKTELEDLKFSDPDKWRAELNRLELEAKSAYNATLTEAEKLANQQSELETRAQVLNDFLVSNPNVTINDDVINNDVPPRITKKLDSGEITFNDFLVEVTEFLSSPKVVGDGNTTLSQPNLGKIAGDSKPSSNAVNLDIAQIYNDTIY